MDLSKINIFDEKMREYILNLIKAKREHAMLMYKIRTKKQNSKKRIY